MRRVSCIHCGDALGKDEIVNRWSTCSRCAVLTNGLTREAGSDDEPAPTATARRAKSVAEPETEEARRQRFHNVRVAHVRESFERGRRCLLARALDPQRTDWASIRH